MSPTSNAIYAYGNIIYNPSGKVVPDDVIAHEETHCRQQGADPDFWWSRYIEDKYFRIDQEAEAYAVQYDFVCKNIIKDRNQRNNALLKLAEVLASPTYGSVIGKSAAYQMIKSRSKTQR